MREILFRGKVHNNDVWIVGGLLYDEENNEAFIAEHFEDRAAYLRKVDPETVGQYTGLADKNCKKIFEGDIVDCWSEGVNAQGTVQQRRDGLWIIYPAWQKHIMWGLCPDEYSNTTVEVIGNIHDNPELMKGGAE